MMIRKVYMNIYASNYLDTDHYFDISELMPLPRLIYKNNTRTKSTCECIAKEILDNVASFSPGRAVKCYQGDQCLYLDVFVEESSCIDNDIKKLMKTLERSKIFTEKLFIPQKIKNIKIYEIKEIYCAEETIKEKGYRLGKYYEYIEMGVDNIDGIELLGIVAQLVDSSGGLPKLIEWIKYEFKKITIHFKSIIDNNQIFYMKKFYKKFEVISNQKHEDISLIRMKSNMGGTGYNIKLRCLDLLYTVNANRDGTILSITSEQAVKTDNV